MLRRWGILLGMLTLLAGMAVTTTGSASAGTMGFRPGGPIQLAGSASAVPNARGGIRHQAESTNWSGYAATTGTYTSVSASWTEPTGTCSGSAKYSSFWVGLHPWLEPHHHGHSGRGAPVLGRGHRGGAVLHGQRRHPAAG